MVYGLPRIYVGGHSPCKWMFDFCLQDLTSRALQPFTRFMCASVQGPLAFTNCFGWSQDVWAHAARPFQKFLRKGNKVREPASHFFLLNVASGFYWKRRWSRLLEVEDCTSFPGTVAALRGYTFIQRNGPNKVPRSLKAETSAGTICRLLAEFNSVK